MGNDDALYRFRLGVFALAKELGNVRAACRMMGIHHSTFYRWKNQLERHGTEILRPRERRRPRMPNATSPFVEHRIVAFALGHPGFGPARVSAELCRDKWGGIVISPSGVWRVLKRHGLNTRSKRLGLVAGYAAPEREKPLVLPTQHLQVESPGELVQMDCFYIGRLQGVKGTVWQYTAIDVASSYTWAELWTTPRNPAALRTSRVAHGLAARGWKLGAVMTDNASEYRSNVFRNTIEDLGAEHRFIRAGQPQTNGCVERVQQTILEECWKPCFARYLTPKITGLRRDLNQYLHYYNTDRAHRPDGTKDAPHNKSSGNLKCGPNQQEASPPPGNRTT